MQYLCAICNLYPLHSPQTSTLCLSCEESVSKLTCPICSMMFPTHAILAMHVHPCRYKTGMMIQYPLKPLYRPSPIVKNLNYYKEGYMLSDQGAALLQNVLDNILKISLREILLLKDRMPKGVNLFLFPFGMYFYRFQSNISIYFILLIL
jgi:hypothetical protein